MVFARERESDSAQDIDNLIDSILASIINLESRLEPLFCHTERSEVSQKDFSCHSEGAHSATEESQQNPQNRDISAFSKPQYDKNIDCHDLTASNLAMTDLLKSLPTPPKQGWERVKLGDLGRICMCKRVMKHETNSISGIPFYKIGTFGAKADAYISQELYENYKTKFAYPKRGQILISAAGTIGKAVIYDGEPAYFQDSNIVWVDTNRDKILDRFLFFVYQTIEWKKEVGTSGGIIERIYNENLRQLKIPLPPLREQEKIIACIEAIESKISALDSTLPALERTKSQILQKYL